MTNAMKALNVVRSQGGNALDVRKVKRAVSNTLFISIGLVIIAAIAMVPFFILLSPVGEKHVFIVFTMEALCGYSSAILGCVFFARELATAKPKALVSQVPGRQRSTVIHDV